MLLSGIAKYIAVLLLLPIGGALVGFAVRLRLRQRARQPLPDVEDAADEPFAGVPLLIRPRVNAPVVPSPSPSRELSASPSHSPTPVPSRFPQLESPSRTVEASAAQPPLFSSTTGPMESDAAMQLLPGWLEPLNSDVHQEIRFIKQPGIDRFTLGRSNGPAYSHIQLTAPTASRMHAYMRLVDGRWRIGNLSDTNPVIVNGSRLREGEWMLENGDRIELGEIAFAFRDR